MLLFILGASLVVWIPAQANHDFGRINLRNKHVRLSLLGSLQPHKSHLEGNYRFFESVLRPGKGYAVHEDVDETGSEFYTRHVDIGDNHYTYDHVKKHKPPFDKIQSVPLGNVLIATTDNFEAVILGEDTHSELTFLTSEEDFPGELPETVKIKPASDVSIKPLHLPVPVKIPHPYIVQVPVPVEIEKTVHVPVEKKVPFPIENPVPVKVVKKIHFPVPHHYPVPIPVYHTKLVVHGDH